MRKLAAITLAASVFLSFATLVSAEDSERSPKPFIQKIQTASQEMKEKSASREGQRKERLDDLRKSIVKNFFNTMIKRFEAALERFSKILTRIESRVAKIKSEDPSKDLTKVDSDIATAKAMLASIRSKIDASKVDFDAMITSTNPKEQFQKVKDDIATIKKDLESLRRMLSQIIGEIKGLHIGETKR